MKIERDTAHILSGVRHGKTIGSPISVLLENRDWKNWQQQLPVEKGEPSLHKRVASPRPGHADLAGALKYNFPRHDTFWSVPQRANLRLAWPSVRWPNCFCKSWVLKY